MTEPRSLGQVFVELADTLVADFDVVEFMTNLAHDCVELLHASEAGVVLADERDLLRSVASSHETARLLELFELQIQEGPCLDCYRTGEQIPNQSLAGGPADHRWPRFGPEARRLGFVMVDALPMRLRGHVIGAVNIFATDATALTPAEIDLGQALADVATIGLLQERSIREARVLSEQLQAALSSRVVIEQAKGNARRAPQDRDGRRLRCSSHVRPQHQPAAQPRSPSRPRRHPQRGGTRTPLKAI